MDPRKRRTTILKGPAGWAALVCCGFLFTAGYPGAYSPSLDEVVVPWLIAAAISVAITSVWYWLGARLFGQKPTFGNCIVAAIIPPILMFVAALVAGFIAGLFACISDVLGYLVLAVAVVYLIFLYIKWVGQILELESTGVAFLLVIIPMAANAVINVAIKSGGL